MHKHLHIATAMHYYLYFRINVFPRGDGPLLEVLQYQGNPRGGRSKLLSTPQVTKIGLIAWGSVTPVRAIKLERTVIST